MVCLWSKSEQVVFRFGSSCLFHSAWFPFSLVPQSGKASFSLESTARAAQCMESCAPESASLLSLVLYPTSTLPVTGPGKLGVPAMMMSVVPFGKVSNKGHRQRSTHRVSHKPCKSADWISCLHVNVPIGLSPSGLDAFHCRRKQQVGTSRVIGPSSSMV